jgi:cell wall assembly regulator SMI1
LSAAITASTAALEKRLDQAVPPELREQMERVEKRLEHAVPPELREQMERMEKQIMELDAAITASTAALEKRPELPVPPELREQMERVEKRLEQTVPPELLEQMERMEKQIMELGAAITASTAALEKRLEHMETQLGAVKAEAKEDLDRAAASAAARILREELTAILTEEAEAEAGPGAETG